MSDPAFVSSLVGENNTATTVHPVTLPATMTVGQRIVVWLTVRLAPAILSIPAGWAHVHAPAVEDVGQVTLVCISKIAEAGDIGSTISITTDAAQKSTWIVFLISDASTIYAGTARTDQGITGSPNPPNLPLPGGPAPTLYLIALATRDGQSDGDVQGPTNYNSTRRFVQSSVLNNGVSTGASYRTTLTSAAEDPGAWGLGTSRRALAQTYGVQNTLQAIVAPFTASTAQSFAGSVKYLVGAPFTPSTEQSFGGNLVFDQTVAAPFTTTSEQTFGGDVITVDVGAPFTPSEEQSFGGTVTPGTTTIVAPFTASSERTFRATITGGDRVVPIFNRVKVGPFAGALGDLALISGSSQGAAFATRWETRGAIGFTDFAPFVAGEYEFDGALVWLKMSVEEVERTFAITRAKLNIDVPDVIDSGELDVPIGGVRIAFDRFFYTVPKVVANFVAGTGLTTVPRATIRDDVDREGFYITLHYGDDVTDSVAGRVHWVAQGY